MAYTEYGEFMRVQRIKHHEVMGDLAILLGVRVPFISAVENGKRNVPEEWIPKIIDHYNLTPDEEANLKNAVEKSKTQIKFNLMNASVCQRNVAMQFQRSFENLDDETANRIIELLNRGDN